MKEEGLATFDLTALESTVNGGSGDPVNWYSDPNATTPIPNPSAYLTTGGTVYAVVSDGMCESIIVEISLTVIPAPTAFPTQAQECDEGNGMATFDLTALDATVNGNSGDPVSWFEDANGTIPISTPWNYNSSGGAVYASVDNGVCSSSIVEIWLEILQAPVIIATSAEACDDGNGMATFDLTLMDNIINAGNNNTVNWFLDNNGNSPIPDPSNFTSGNGSVYAQVDDGDCSSEIVEIPLTVIPAPTANPASDTQCEENPGQATFDLTSLDNIVNGGSGNPVSWFFRC